MRYFNTLWAAGLAIGTAAAAGVPARAEPVTRSQSFDRDPGWDHANNRPADRGDEPVTIRQDFGFSPTSHAGGNPGELGGFIQAAAEPA